MLIWICHVLTPFIGPHYIKKRLLPPKVLLPPYGPHYIKGCHKASGPKWSPPPMETPHLIEEPFIFVFLAMLAHF